MRLQVGTSMIVYHGTNVNFERIDLRKSRNNRDFGKGFYTTSLFEQAVRWAENQFLRYGGGGCFVKYYDFSASELLNVKKFDKMDGEWLDFVRTCRIQGGIPHDYDIVVGPVANDNTMRTIALYIAGIYTTNQAIDQLRFFRANNQISFHTEAALHCLQFLETKESSDANLLL